MCIYREDSILITINYEDDFDLGETEENMTLLKHVVKEYQFCETQ